MSGGRARVRLEWLALLLTLAPLIVSALHLLFGVGRGFTNFGDVAGLELRTRDAGRYMLWVGPYSRDDWYHPGPALFYVLAAPYRLLGSSSVALLVGGLLVNGASVIGMALLARRRGGTPLMLATLVGCALVLRSLGPDHVRVPWNPFITVLPYGLLLFLVWAIACRDRWALPLAVFVASFLTQTHVGYFGLTVPLLLGGVVWLVVSTVRAARQPDLEQRPRLAGLTGLAGPTVSAAVVGTLMWLPPLIQQINNEPGNLGRMIAYLRWGGDTHPLVSGWRVVAAQYVWAPEWVAGRGPRNFVAEPAYVHERVLPVLLLVVLGAAIVLWRRREPTARALIVVWVGASILGIVATARTIGALYAYRLDWAWMLGMVGGLLVVSAGYTAALGAARQAQIVKFLTGAAVALLAGLAVVSGVSMVQAGTPDVGTSGAMEELFPDVRESLPPGDGDVLVNGTGFTSFAYQTSLVLDLERHGVPAKVRSDALGEHRKRVTGDPLRAELFVAVGTDLDPFLEDPGYEMLAYSGRIPADEVVEWTDLEEEVLATGFAIEECFPGVPGGIDRDRSGREAELLEIFCGHTKLPTIDSIGVFVRP